LVEKDLSFEFKRFKHIVEVNFFIDIIMKTSPREYFSFIRFFDEDIKHEFLILKDMVQIMFEDRRESTMLHEKLSAMNQEKEEILQRLHDMEL